MPLHGLAPSPQPSPREQGREASKKTRSRDKHARRAPLFDILNQLANFLERPLNLHDPARDFHIARLGTDRISLPEHFLG